MNHKLWIINDESAHEKVIYPMVNQLENHGKQDWIIFPRYQSVTRILHIFSYHEKYASFHEMNAQFWLDHDITHSLEES